MVLVDYIGIFLHVAILLATYCIQSRIYLLDKSWIARYHTWYHRLSRILFIKRAVLAIKKWGRFGKIICILKK